MVHYRRDLAAEKIDLVDLPVNCATQVFVQSEGSLQELSTRD